MVILYKETEMDLSIIMAARNDNYGGEVYRDVEPATPTPQRLRMAQSFYTLHEAFKNIDYEVIVVEWNPIKGVEKISDWPFMQHPKVRFIEVPDWFSDGLIGNQEFHEYHAKNVGIRRAFGKYVLCTNPDILWLHPMNMEFLKMEPMIALRVSVRHGVLKQGFQMDKIRGFCSERDNVMDPDLQANGDFTLMSAPLWFFISGFRAVAGKIAGTDMWAVERAARTTGKIAKLPFPIFHIRHPGRPQDSAYGVADSNSDWGFPNERFKEYINGEERVAFHYSQGNTGYTITSTL
jgi:hypothetical protein